MGRPAILCRLERGKLLDAQPGFVDTFNWLVDFIENLRGEGEVVGGGESTIRVDRTDTSRPVIRGGGNGGNVVLDEVSVGRNSDQKVEIKGWAADAEQVTSLADVLTASSAVPGAVVVRTAGGQLHYVPFGTMNPQPSSALVWKDPS